MPALDTLPDDHAAADIDTARILVFARGNAGKSSWIFRSAAAKHNVVYLDFDGCAGLIKDVPEEHRKRFFYLPAYGRVEEVINILKSLIASRGKLVYDFNRKKLVSLTATGQDETIPVTYLDLMAADRSTIFVTDSWTRICHSIVMQDTDVDFNDLEKMDYSAQDYSTMYRTANGVALWFSRLKCHTVMLAHEQEYIKYKPGRSMFSPIPKGQDASIHIEERLTQPESLGAKHSPTFSSFYNQVFRLVYDSAVDARKVSTQFPAGGTLVDFGASNTLNGDSSIGMANMPFSKVMEMAKLVPPSVQPLTDVARDTTLGELRAALREAQQANKPVLDLGAHSTK